MSLQSGLKSYLIRSIDRNRFSQNSLELWCSSDKTATLAQSCLSSRTFHLALSVNERAGLNKCQRTITLNLSLLRRHCKLT